MTNPKTTAVAESNVNQLQAGAVMAGGTLKESGKNVAELILFDDNLFDKVQRWGQMMAGSKSMVPRHLQGNPSDCSAVVMQALRWGIDPYACAQKTHVISGTLGYEAQLVNAILLANAPIEGRPKYEKIGDWTKIIGKFKWLESKKTPGQKYQVPDWKTEDEKGLGVKLSIKMKGEEVQPFELLLSQATVRNSTLWASDPFQQLCYLAIKRWARLHCPDVIMGVYTPDELEEVQSFTGPDNAKDVTPVAESKAEAFAASNEKVDKETGEVTEDPKPDSEKPASNEKGKQEVVHIKTPAGTGPQSGSIACNGILEAAEKLIKAVESRYNNPAKASEIKVIKDNNQALFKRIENELPDMFIQLYDLTK